MIRNAPTPAFLRAFRSFTTATRTYKPPPDNKSFPQRFTIKPRQSIAEAITLPPHKIRGSPPDRFSKSFQLRYRKVHAYTLTALSGQELKSPYGEDRFSRRWYNRTDSLWWSAIAFRVFAFKRVVRSHGTRKLRVAFTESLKKKGIAPDGSWIEPHAQRTRDPVYGTAQLTAFSEILNTRMEDLVLETDKAVELVLRCQNREDVPPVDNQKNGGLKGGKRGSKKDLPSGERNAPRQDRTPRAGTGLRVTR